MMPRLLRIAGCALAAWLIAFFAVALLYPGPISEGITLAMRWAPRFAALCAFVAWVLI